MKLGNGIVNVGVNSHDVDLFEGQYEVPYGMAYNSYLILDEKIAVLDTVDARFGDSWLDNVGKALEGRLPDYLVVHHMEPDHSSNIARFLEKYPDVTVVSSLQSFKAMEQFFGKDVAPRRFIVDEGDILELGHHNLRFVAAPMVHWPEVVVSYDASCKTLFSADAFGKFGATDVEDPRGWDFDARRYYIGIVGKYGLQVQALLKKAAGLQIERICPLHGPVLEGDSIAHAVGKYQTWSSYAPESEGVAISFTSVYGHTREAVMLLRDELLSRGCPDVAVVDLARGDHAEAVANAFRYGKLVLATTTYNSGIFPFMRDFIQHLSDRAFKNRDIALIENGTWAPLAAKIMKSLLAGCPDIRYVEPVVTLRSAMTDATRAQIAELAAALVRE